MAVVWRIEPTSHDPRQLQPYRDQRNKQSEQGAFKGPFQENGIDNSRVRVSIPQNNAEEHRRYENQGPRISLPKARSVFRSAKVYKKLFQWRAEKNDRRHRNRAAHNDLDQKSHFQSFENYAIERRQPQRRILGIDDFLRIGVIFLAGAENRKSATALFRVDRFDDNQVFGGFLVDGAFGPNDF
ncbi:hypothetical protein RZS28_16120 [Methylocapsa polymorpha]|uniref:Uncharacterized protein n=1 Tax=Methylocapsa polymorpha TaxID=3080828 RepID=A0ABZ0HPW4_9HYPH|nr:hypothetical protein RZS28_16120 [Methylocapsa sp. RX1]